MSDYEASDYNSESDGSDSEIETTQPQKKITIKIGSNDKSIPKVSTNIDDYENSDSDISEVEVDEDDLEEEPQIGGVGDFDSDEDEVEDEDTKKERYALCEECPHLLATKQCTKCGCFMPAKTGLLHATCPINKW